tara:strand:+ start:356 stop:946 length:591 start_codon:yes stop_codon:yes gene_type:complete
MSAVLLSPESINDLTLERLRHMTEQELLAIWSAAPAPALDELHGEYQSAMPMPIAERHDDFHHKYGLGEWIGKAFAPISHANFDGQGHNLCIKDGVVQRWMRFGTRIGSSIVDGRPALMMHYNAFDNLCAEPDLVDEIRKVRRSLYVAVCTMAANNELFGEVDPDTSRTPPLPFLLRGPFALWHGPDDPEFELRPQ